MAKLKLTTGVKTYEIEDENGNFICELSINTSDLNMFHRLRGMEEKVKAAVPDFEQYKTDEEAMEMLNSEVLPNADKEIRKIIDEAFDSDICDRLFGNTNCLSLGPDGTTYVERFINMIAPAIVSDFEESIKASEKRISKYTSQVK